MKILVLNSGSSSQKSCLYEIDADLPENPPSPIWEAKVEWDSGSAKISMRNSKGAFFNERVNIESRQQAIEHLFHSVWNGDVRVMSKPSEIGVVGHRIVHGGPKFEEPTLITEEVKQAIADLSAFAPLHNRAELDAIQMMEQLLPGIAQVAVFDTGFHRNLPLAAAVYTGPFEWFQRNIRRYGFHGINHEYCAKRAAQMLGRHLDSLKVVSCHLGNGCSLAAISNGQSVDTTMGFTPLEGLMMGTRSGSVDPGILTYLMREEGLNGRQVDELLNNKSGLLGISGVSSDMRQILEAMKSGNKRAELAFEIFVHRLRSCIGSMLAALGGLDVLIFTAGIGENSAEVRAAACEPLEFLGLRLDEEKNLASRTDCDVAAKDSSVRVFVLQAQEDWAIARECWKLGVAHPLPDRGPNREV